MRIGGGRCRIAFFPEWNTNGPPPLTYAVCIEISATCIRYPRGSDVKNVKYNILEVKKLALWEVLDLLRESGGACA
jgi:hypothetical protein